MTLVPVKLIKSSFTPLLSTILRGAQRGKITNLTFANVFFLWENGAWATATGNHKQKNGNRTRVSEKNAGK